MTCEWEFSKFDRSQDARRMIWTLISVLEDCTNWYDLDDDHRRCLADHHMTVLLEANLHWTYQFGQFRNELQRIGCRGDDEL